MNVNLATALRRDSRRARLERIISTWRLVIVQLRGEGALDQDGANSVYEKWFQSG